MKKVLILCTGNSCRSQMAEGWLRYFLPGTKVYSAGTKPEKVNKYAVHVMKESGINISANTSNHVNEYISTKIDFLITVCDNAKEKCPYFPRVTKRYHNSFDDPANAQGTDAEKLLVYRKVSAQIKDYMRHFCDNQINK